MGTKIHTEISIDIGIGDPIELTGDYDPSEAGEDSKGGLSVHVSDKSLAELADKPLGTPKEAGDAFGTALLGDGHNLGTRLEEELKKISLLDNIITPFLEAKIYLTALKYDSGKTFTIGMKIERPAGSDNLLGVINWKYIAIVVTSDLSKPAPTKE